uniref:Uncharacterized protein n=1 Tax=Schistocephalus solidus TaxID=70667 RepID=A0A0X3PDY9_SCHSO
MTRRLVYITELEAMSPVFAPERGWFAVDVARACLTESQCTHNSWLGPPPEVAVNFVVRDGQNIVCVRARAPANNFASVSLFGTTCFSVRRGSPTVFGALILLHSPPPPSHLRYRLCRIGNRVCASWLRNFVSGRPTEGVRSVCWMLADVAGALGVDCLLARLAGP